MWKRSIVCGIAVLCLLGCSERKYSSGLDLPKPIPPEPKTVLDEYEVEISGVKWVKLLDNKSFLLVKDGESVKKYVVDYYYIKFVPEGPLKVINHKKRGDVFVWIHVSSTDQLH